MKDKLVYPLDRDGYNCRVENLALATRSELRKSEFKRGRYKCLIPFLPKEKAAAMHRKIGIKLRKEICKYHPDGTLLATYPSLTAAAARNKVSISNIGSSASGRIHLLKGHVYRYKEDTYNGELKNYDSSKRQPIVQYALDGKKIADFPSIKEAAIQLKIHPNGIANTAKGKSRHAGGFIWRFEGESYNGEYRNILKKRKCIQLSLSGKQIRVFESVSLAAKTTGADFSGIKKVVDGARYSCKGYKWKWG
jgi:hypothetical protein